MIVPEKKVSISSTTKKTMAMDLMSSLFLERDANQVTDSDISYAKGDLAAAKNELSQIELMLADLNSLQTDNEKYTQAKAKVDVRSCSWASWSSWLSMSPRTNSRSPSATLSPAFTHTDRTSRVWLMTTS